MQWALCFSSFFPFLARVCTNRGSAVIPSARIGPAGAFCHNMLREAPGNLLGLCFEWIHTLLEIGVLKQIRNIAFRYIFLPTTIRGLALLYVKERDVDGNNHNNKFGPWVYIPQLSLLTSETYSTMFSLYHLL